jgi:ubiquinone biosynthesis protein Coq4
MTEGLGIMHHDIWNMITNADPGVAGTVLLAAFISVMAWVWWPAGFLIP